MKKRNGFTLIELLAVIVILAVIALIATPIIMNIIDDSKKATLPRLIQKRGKLPIRRVLFLYYTRSFYKKQYFFEKNYVWY